MAITIPDDELLALIEPDIDDAEDWSRQLSEERMEAAALYDRAPLGNEVEGFSSYVAATVFDTINWLKPGLTAIFTHPDFFTVQMEDSDRADKNKKLLRHQLFSKQNGSKIIRDYVENALKYHNGFIKTCFYEEYDDVSMEHDRLNEVQFEMFQAEGYEPTKFDRVEEITTDEMGEQIITVYYENVKGVKKEEKFRGPKSEAIPNWELLTSPGSKGIDDSRVVIHRTERTLDYIRRGEQTGRFRKGSADRAKEYGDTSMDVAELRDEWEYNYTLDDLDVNEREDQAHYDNKQQGPGSTVYVDEIYTKLDVDGDGLLEPVIIWKTGTVVLNITENPYGRPPIREGKLFEIPFRLEGQPLPLLIKDDQKEMTNLTRIYTDAAAEASYGTMLTDNAKFASEWSQRTIGDTLLNPSIKGGHYDYVKSEPPSQTTLDAIEMKRGDYERTTGVNSLNQGLTTDSMGKTATGTVALQNAGQQRQKLYATVLGETLQKMLKDMMWINMTWPPEEAFTVLGSSSIEITPEDLSGEHDIKIEVGVGPQDRMQQAGVLEQHFQKLATVLISAGVAGPEHLAKTERKIGKLMDISFDDLMFTEKEFNSIQQMQQQMQQMQAQLQKVQGAEAMAQALINQMKEMGVQPNAEVQQVSQAIQAQATQSQAQAGPAGIEGQAQGDAGNVQPQGGAGPGIGGQQLPQGAIRPNAAGPGDGIDQPTPDVAQ